MKKVNKEKKVSKETVEKKIKEEFVDFVATRNAYLPDGKTFIKKGEKVAFTKELAKRVIAEGNKSFEKIN